MLELWYVVASLHIKKCHYVLRQTDAGGEVEVIASEARERFAGSEQFGVTSDTSGAYIRSLVFVTPKLTQ